MTELRSAARSTTGPGTVHVLLLGDVDGRISRRLATLGPRLECVDILEASPRRRAAAEILLVWDFRSRDVETYWPQLASLRWIHTASAGVDHVLFPGLLYSNVQITNSAGIYSEGIAEYALAFMLMDAKDIEGTLAAQASRAWRYRETRLLRGRSLLVVGLGDVGIAIARLATAVGMRVSGVRRSASSSDLDNVSVFTGAQLVEALAEAEYVAVSTPLTRETEGLIGEREIAAMKPGAYLVNLARGGVVDERAVVNGLRSGQLRGAVLDVLREEPIPPEDELWAVPGLVVSPHMAGDTLGWQDRVLDLLTANVERYLGGLPLSNVVDKARGY